MSVEDLVHPLVVFFSLHFVRDFLSSGVFVEISFEPLLRGKGGTLPQKVYSLPSGQGLDLFCSVSHRNQHLSDFSL